MEPVAAAGERSAAMWEWQALIWINAATADRGTVQIARQFW
jgi:hypothetical protein